MNMRKLIMWNLQSLDGYFDGSKAWDLDWHNAVWGPELEQLSLEQLSTMGAILVGRATYEGMASYWTTATGAVADLVNAVPKLVFSHTLTTADWNNTRLVTEPAEVEVARLKSEPGKDRYIFGSANLSDTFIKHGLIDEFRLCVARDVPRRLADRQTVAGALDARDLFDISHHVRLAASCGHIPTMSTYARSPR